MPCNAYYSTGTFECSGYRDGIYIYLSAHPMYGDPNPNNLYVFDPYTGRSVTSSSRSTTSATCTSTYRQRARDHQLHRRLALGLLPDRQPFSAAVHDPSQVVINIYADSGTRRPTAVRSPHRICPIEA